MDPTPDASPGLTVATFNVALSGETPDALAGQVASAGDPQLQQIAAILQHIRPQIVLLQEIDQASAEAFVRDFHANYLSVPQTGWLPSAQPIAYPHHHAPPVNTGQPTGQDLNGDGSTTQPHDAHGWGVYPGQYGMVILSQYPIDADAIVSLQDFTWQSLPDHRMPQGHFPPAAEPVLRLSSKTHADVPIQVSERTLHVIIAHPTPPVFDGPEDRNGRRNADEIRLLAEYLTPTSQAVPSTLQADAFAVVMGDLNADPHDGDSLPTAMQPLLAHPRLQDPQPASEGAVEAAATQGGHNATHAGPASLDTADFGDENPGNLRVDYVLPTRNLTVQDAGVAWWPSDHPLAPLNAASDHRLVWVELAFPE